MTRKEEGNLPATNEGYGTQEYWEQRYTNEAPGTSFDWFLTPEYLLPLLASLSPAPAVRDTRVLMLGCGNSRLSPALAEAGYGEVLSVDYSPKCIDDMRARYPSARQGSEGKEPDIGGLRWEVMDVLDLQLPDGTPEAGFDWAIDKGTMDALLTSKGDPWNPPERDVERCMKEVDEALRVLKKTPTSKFIYFTFGQPHFRKRYLANRPGFTLDVQSIGPAEGFEYFMYVLSYTGSE